MSGADISPEISSLEEKLGTHRAVSRMLEQWPASWRDITARTRTAGRGHLWVPYYLMRIGAHMGDYEELSHSFVTLNDKASRLFEAFVAGRIMAPVLSAVALQEHSWRDRKPWTYAEEGRRDVKIIEVIAKSVQLQQTAAEVFATSQLDIQMYIPSQPALLQFARDVRAKDRTLSPFSEQIIQRAYPRPT